MRVHLWVLACAVSLFGTVAMADEPAQPSLLSKIGMTVEAGGGVGGFTDTRATDVTKVAGGWTARLTVGSRYHLGGEAAYVGSAQTLSTLGVDKNAILMANGVEGALRLNVLTGIVQPYALAGVGWLHYTVTNTATNNSDVRDSSDVAQFPLGVGVAIRYQGFVADARFALHPAADANLMGKINLTTWDVGARLGFEF